MRMNFQRSAKTDRSFLVLAKGHMAKALTGSGAEMIGIARQRCLAIRDGAFEVLHQITDRRSLVPSFSKIRRQSNDAGEYNLCLRQILALHRLHSSAKDSVHFQIPRPTPAPPEHCLGSGCKRRA